MLYGAPIPQRRDAQRNRSAILRAASELLMDQPAGAQIPEIARRAGVGQATLYRHFRDRHALIAAVVADQLDRLEASVHANADFRPLLTRVLRTQVAMRPLVERIGGLDRLAHRVVVMLTPALRRAQAAGDVRPDLTPEDLVRLFTMLSAAPEERSIALLLDGVFSG
ncbi:TetR family transcriptional regulator [Dactylosporangium sp. CA-139066]|uniref:TetR family transcriptional regulator n=1 Tax=Dactylosporangium sp. CA-139066 TaxID=3239930 RepID=UPI003D9020EE